MSFNYFFARVLRCGMRCDVTRRDATRWLFGTVSTVLPMLWEPWLLGAPAQLLTAATVPWCVRVFLGAFFGAACRGDLVVANFEPDPQRFERLLGIYNPVAQHGPPGKRHGPPLISQPPAVLGVSAVADANPHLPTSEKI